MCIDVGHDNTEKRHYSWKPLPVPNFKFQIQIWHHMIIQYPININSVAALSMENIEDKNNLFLVHPQRSSYRS